MKHLLTALIMLGGLVSLILAAFLYMWLEEKCKNIWESNWFKRLKKIVGRASVGICVLIFIIAAVSAYCEIYSKL